MTVFVDGAPRVLNAGDRVRKRVPGSYRTQVERVSDCGRFVLVRLAPHRLPRWVAAEELQTGWD